MLKIRFQRVGKKNRPHFRLVLTEVSSAPKKKAQEILGFWDPIKKEKNIKVERVKYWLSVGAKTSPTANNFLVSENVIQGSKIPVHKQKPESTEVSATPVSPEEVKNPEPQNEKQVSDIPANT